MAIILLHNKKLVFNRQSLPQAKKYTKIPCSPLVLKSVAVKPKLKRKDNEALSSKFTTMSEVSLDEGP
jgi:hypothetical protein